LPITGLFRHSPLLIALRTQASCLAAMWTSGSLGIFSLSISRNRTGLTRHLRCIMRFFCSTLVLSLCAAFCHAQAATDDATLLKQARAKYDAPFERNLQSFNCAVEFNWKQHFTEVVRLGDEGTDEEIAQFIQPIRNRVTVTRQNVAVSAGMTEGEVNKLPMEAWRKVSSNTLCSSA
jgi:hypothetical protein